MPGKMTFEDGMIRPELSNSPNFITGFCQRSDRIEVIEQQERVFVLK
jgi:hypothetical protein